MRAFLAAAPPRRGSRVGATYSLPLDALGEAELADERARLTLQAKCSFGAPPPPFAAWREEGGRLHVPRFYGLERFGPAEADDRVDGAPANLTFVGTPTEVQARAWEAVSARHLRAGGGGGAMVSLPCGFGKTVLATWIAAMRARKTLVLVHKGVIRDQWIAAFGRFCPGCKVGVLQGAKWPDADCDVVVAMIMTLAKREYDPAVFGAYGTVVVDEAHHIAAPVLSRAMRFPARWVLGLSATKDRPDGLTPLLHWSLGPEGFRAERDAEGVKVSVALFPQGCREILTRDGKPLVATMLNALAANPRRNAFLADRIAALRAAGRVLMVLSDRLAQIDALRALVVARGVPEAEVGVFKGGMRDADRDAQLARPVVMCTYGMANEGVDKKEADTCVLATPKGRVIQAIGRVQRPCATKKYPLVVDVCDDVSIFVPMRWTRQRLYDKERYEVQVLPHGAPAGAWFA